MTENVHCQVDMHRSSWHVYWWRFYRGSCRYIIIWQLT